MKPHSKIEQIIELQPEAQQMNDEELRFIDQRLTKLETKFEERWASHEKRYDEIYQEIKSTLKDLGLKFQIMQERYLTQHELCMKEVDNKLTKVETESTEKIDNSEKKIWKVITFVMVAIPTLFYTIYELALVLVSAFRK